LLCKLSGRELHRATDWDANNAFILVDPSVSVQRLLCVFARGFQIFHALFGSHLFVIASTRRGPNYREHDYAEQREEKHDP
jgi:hypothetical protein